MPAKPRWLLDLQETLDRLSDLSVPVLDQSIIERLYRVRCRRAIESLSHFCGCRYADGWRP